MSHVDSFFQRCRLKPVLAWPSIAHKIFFLYFCFCALVLVDFLPASWANDATAVLGMASGEVGGEDSGSYYLTALFFGALGDFSIFFILIVGYFWAGELSIYATNFRSGVILLISTTPGLLMGMIRPQKDVFIGVVIVLVLYSFRRFYSDTKKLLLAWITVYLLYAAVMRPYYFLILSLFLLIVFLKKITKLWPLSLLSFVMAASFLLSRDQMILLQGARDEVNFIRGVDEEQRTAFTNIYPYIESTYEFWANYFHAFIYLNFPVLNYFDLQALVLQAYILLYIALLVVFFLVNDDRWVNYLCALFLACFLFYPIFEPDLGSYTRHISLASAYLAPVIMLQFPSSRARAGFRRWRGLR